MTKTHSAIFLFPCPICDGQNEFQVLWLDGDPSLAGPTLCVECGKPFSSAKVLAEALVDSSEETNRKVD